MEKPLVSVWIPAYNHEKYVGESIKSVINQTYENIELIIINDGSKDNTHSEILKLSDICKKRFTNYIYINRENKGLVKTLNEIISLSSGIYFCGHASDDILFPDVIEKNVFFLQMNPNVAVSSGSVILIDEYGNLFKRQLIKGFSLLSFEDIFFRKSSISAPGCFIRTNVLKEVGGYDEGSNIEDWSMWLKITNLGYNIAIQNFISAYYRRHLNNLSKQIELMHKFRMEIFSQYKEHPKYNDALQSYFINESTSYFFKDFNYSKKFFKKIKISNYIKFLKKLLKAFIIYIVFSNKIKEIIWERI